MDKSDLRKNFGQVLLDKGLISPEQMQKAIDHQKEHNCSLNESILTLGAIDERQLLIQVSTYLSIPPIKVTDLNISADILKLIPSEIAEKYQVLPIGKIGNVLTVAMADPLNIVAIDDLERITKHQINPVISLRSQMQEVIENRYKKTISESVEAIIKDSDISTIEVIEDDSKEMFKDSEIMSSVDEAPVIKLTNYILKEAVEENASDVLIEPLSYNSRVRLRIDGTLRESQTFSRKMHPFVISRVKVMANLNITEHRRPQEGRFRLNLLDKNVDFRISILPSTLGEKVAVRILDESQGLLDLEKLGFQEDVTKQLKEDSKSSHGMILVCGPTGCGKTTSLYSILRHIYTPEKNIITVEDPIEYQLAGINQVNVNYEVGLLFSSALRSILRQDPDVIMIGEIRDSDTIDIAIKAALTGHLLLSTLHTTTAPGSVTRLVNMGVEPFLLSSTLIGVLSQRLIRKICPHCKEIDNVEEKIKIANHLPAKTTLYKTKGCNLCTKQGYKGRVGLGEYLHLDPELSQLIYTNCEENAIKKAARLKGMRTLREEGLLKVIEGITTLEEVFRHTMRDND
ncbi:MAG: GspE/PulE family protein [Candidatus Omnitrophota bacterium]